MQHQSSIDGICLRRKYEILIDVDKGEEDIEREDECQVIFAMIDTDKSGFLDKNELRTAVAGLGKLMSDNEF